MNKFNKFLAVMGFSLCMNGLSMAAPILRPMTDDQMLMVNMVMDNLIQESDLTDHAIKVSLVEGMIMSENQQNSKEDFSRIASAKFELEFDLNPNHEFAPLKSSIQIGINLEKDFYAILFGNGKAPVLDSNLPELFEIGELKVSQMAKKYPDYQFTFRHDNYVENDYPWVYADLNVDRTDVVNAQGSFHFNLTTSDYFFHVITRINPDNSTLGYELRETINDMLMSIIEQREVSSVSYQNFLASLGQLVSYGIDFDFASLNR